LRQTSASRILGKYSFILILLIFLLSTPGAVPGAAQPQENPQKQAQEQAAQAALQAPVPASPRVLSSRDTLRLSQVSSPRLSPDGAWVLYTQATRDMEDKEMKMVTQIWRTRLDGTERRQMTQGEQSSTSPAWLPDGKRFAFLSSRGKTSPGETEGGERGEGPKSQVFFIYADGGEAWQVTDHAEGVRSFEISPDGKKILFTALDPLSKEEKQKRKDKDDAEVVDEKFRMTHLWVYDLDKKEETRLTEGAFTVSDPQWAPDSRRAAYVTRPTPKVDDGWNSDIWVLDLATKKARQLYENPGSDQSPRWSPDGKTIAFASDPHTGTNTWYKKLYLVSVENGGGGANAPRILLKDFDRDFGTPIWAPDGKTVYWSTGDGTSICLFSVDVESRPGSDASVPVRKIETPRGLNFQWEISRSGKSWAWVHSRPDWPPEIYAADLSLKQPVKLSGANPWLREEKVSLTGAETIRWKNSDGQWIEGVLTRPVGYEPQKKYPLILNPHGGPSGAVMESFSSTNQFFAGNGFMILQPNFRGSSNYGQAFLNANRENWGVVDYNDCMTGVDFCVEKGWADPDRLICYGWSYGGYMSFWTVTQTDRFKAVSPGAGLPDLYSMYSTTDIPGYLGWFFGTPWDDAQMYAKHSPIRYVKNVKSPVLIMHGADDARVPPTQAVEFYQALRDLGKDVTFVRYPREGHGFREPRHQMDRLRRYLDFFSKHVGLTPVSEREEEKKKEEKKEEKKEAEKETPHFPEFP
jgi:dipeptidyl aminopeptidase/acylaminoacyl peptidase